MQDKGKHTRSGAYPSFVPSLSTKLFHAKSSKCLEPPAARTRVPFITCAANKQPWSFAARGRKAGKEAAVGSRTPTPQPKVVRIGGKSPPSRKNDPVSKANLKYLMLKPVSTPYISSQDLKERPLFYAPKAYESLESMLRRERFVANLAEKSRTLRQAKEIMEKNSVTTQVRLADVKKNRNLTVMSFM
jgi:hypothetical protein